MTTPVTNINFKPMRFRFNLSEIAAVLPVLLLCSLNLNAQEDTRPSLLGSGGIENVDLILSPGASFYGYAGEPSISIRLRGGALFSERFGLGGFYEFTVLDVRPEEEPTTRYLDYRAAGGYLEYTFWSDRILSLSVPVFIGAGEVQLDADEDFDLDFGEEEFLVVEPGAILDLRLIPSLSVYGGFSYRFTGGFTYRSFDQSDIQGLTGQLGLKYFIKLGK
jgi:hypothetical protein